MGMFDWISCEFPLPDGTPPRSGFQTKDLDNALLAYRITEDRRLLVERVHYEAVPDSERPPDPGPDASLWDTLDWLQSGSREVSRSWEVVDHHGYVRFYDQGPDKTWREYRAKFTDGRLVELTLLPPPRD